MKGPALLATLALAGCAGSSTAPAPRPAENMYGDSIGDPAADGQSHGILAPAEIQKVVRASFDVFRKCYEAALGRKPKLDGTVRTRFVIDATGAVSKAEDAQSDLPEPAVVACVVAGFTSLRFPEPKGGVVTVVYPIVFHPGS